MTGVIPGDRRVVCQHCPARIRFDGAPVYAWVDDYAAPGMVLFCASGKTPIWHQPMPRVGASR